MTIIAGFKSKDGIVICADTQETFGGTKKDVPKLIFQPSEHSDGSTDDVAAAFCGAGDGPFIEKLIDSAWQDSVGADTLETLCNRIEDSIKSTYADFGAIFQTGHCPSVDLIYGVKMGGRSKLFHAYGPVVIEKDVYVTAGTGSYIGDYIAGRTTSDHPIPLDRAVTLAVYILEEAKKNVEGCGGESHVAILRNDGASGRVGAKQIAAIADTLNMIDRSLGRFLLKTADLSVPDEDFKKGHESLVKVVTGLRDMRRTKLERDIAGWNAAMEGLAGGRLPKTDLYGLREKEEENLDT